MDDALPKTLSGDELSAMTGLDRRKIRSLLEIGVIRRSARDTYPLDSVQAIANYFDDLAVRKLHPGIADIYEVRALRRISSEITRGRTRQKALSILGENLSRDAMKILEGK